MVKPSYIPALQFPYKPQLSVELGICAVTGLVIIVLVASTHETAVPWTGRGLIFSNYKLKGIGTEPTETMDGWKISSHQ